MERRQLYIDGMTCINCQKKIENCLRKRVEIKEASVSYEIGVEYVMDIINRKVITLYVRTAAIPLQWIRSVKVQVDVIRGRFWKKIKQKQIAK